MPLTTTLYDTADYLTTKEQQFDYLAVSFEEDDEAGIDRALATVIRARAKLCAASETSRKDSAVSA